MKIIIIGAGIAGLSFGLACQRAGFECRIYEKTRTLQNIGGGILLWPHGVRYLRWLGLEDCLEPFHTEVQATNVVGDNGQILLHENLSHVNSLLGGMTYPVDRSLLQQTFASKVAENSLHPGKLCVAVHSEPECERVIFADGTEDTADVVIGADGIYSGVRQFLNPDAALEFTGHCWWGGIIEQKEVPGLARDAVYFAPGVGKVCIVWPIRGEKFMWYMPVKLTPVALERENGGRAQLQRLCADWLPEIQQIIQAPPRAQSFCMPIYALPPQRSFTHKRTVLIGDAAHALGPILGQGASMAFEDAYVLMHCLKNGKQDMPSLLKHYEALRIERYKKLYVLETQSAATMINETQETLEQFQEQLKHITLTDMYQELIPLVNENACRRVTALPEMETIAA